MKCSQETNALVLTIKNQGHVPSFKNTKSIFRNRKTGSMFIATNPKRKEWMEQAIKSLKSQLMSLYRTTATETLTEHSLQSWIASHMPEDDSVKFIHEIHVRLVRVPKGEEGAIIKIYKLSDECRKPRNEE